MLHLRIQNDTVMALSLKSTYHFNQFNFCLYKCLSFGNVKKGSLGVSARKKKEKRKKPDDYLNTHTDATVIIVNNTTLT